MELIRRPIHYTQEGKSIFDQFYLDGDYNVPEQKEDVQRIIYGKAELKAEDIRTVENYVKITGKMYFRILYMASSADPRPSSLEGSMPFEEMVYAASEGNESFFLRNARTEFTASVVHSRKLSLRIMAEIEVGREWIRDEELTEDVESETPVCRRTLYRERIHTGSKKRLRFRGRKRASDRYCSLTSASADWISAWDRTRCC